MKCACAVLTLLLILATASRALGWRRDRRYWREIEDEMRRIATVRKSEQTKATVRRPAPIEQPPPETQVRQRLALIRKKIQKLEGEREKAVREERPESEIAALDERIEKLKGEDEEWRTLLGLAGP